VFSGSPGKKREATTLNVTGGGLNKKELFENLIGDIYDHDSKYIGQGKERENPG